MRLSTKQKKKKKQGKNTCRLAEITVNKLQYILHHVNDEKIKWKFSYNLMLQVIFWFSVTWKEIKIKLLEDLEDFKVNLITNRKHVIFWKPRN